MFRKALSVLSVILLLIQTNVFPVLVLAQEVELTSENEEEVHETVDEETLPLVAEEKVLVFVVTEPDLALASTTSPVTENIAEDTQEVVSLTTDKEDYYPTEIVIISSKNLSPNYQYLLVISSADEPAVTSSISIQTDNLGGFVYAYQLDGTYRPNYLVQLFDQSGSLVATTTFLDSKPNTVTVNTQNPNPVEKGQNVTFNVTVNFNGNSNSCTANLSASGLPTGVGVVSFSPASLVSTGGNVSSTLTLSTSSTTPTGSSNFTVTATPSGCQSGSSAQSGNGSLVVSVGDTEKPVGSISIDSGATYTNSRSVSLSFPGTSSDVVTMELRNGMVGSFQSPITYVTPYAYTLPENGDGEYTVSVRFTDGAGNQSEGIISDTIVLDETFPTDPTDVSTTSHTAPKNDTTIDMVWTVAGSIPGATDATSGVDGYSYEFSNGATDVPDNTKDLEETATGITSTSLTDGTWYFHLRTVDNAGNWTSTVHSGPFVVDTTAPTGSITSHSGGETVSGFVVVTADASDSLSGVSSVLFQYKRDDGVDTFHDIETSLTSPFSANWDTSSLDLDTYILRIIVTDGAGNEFTSTEVSVDLAAVVSGELSATPSQTTAVITWTTDKPTSSRVVYDTVSQSALGSAPNYGYAFSTSTFDSLVKTTNHTVIITGLSDGTLYYFRTISEGSPIAVGFEKTFKTLTYAGAPSSTGGGAVAGISTSVDLFLEPLLTFLSPTLVEASEDEGGGEVLGEETQAEDENEGVEMSVDSDGSRSKSWVWVTVLLAGTTIFLVLLKGRRNK